MNLYTLFGLFVAVFIAIPLISYVNNLDETKMVYINNNIKTLNVPTNLTLYNQSTYFYDHPNCSISNNNFYFNNLSLDDYLNVYPYLRFDWVCSKKALVVYTLSFNYTWVSVVV